MIYAEGGKYRFDALKTPCKCLLGAAGVQLSGSRSASCAAGLRGEQRAAGLANQLIACRIHGPSCCQG